jgi:hypothetical protein
MEEGVERREEAIAGRAFAEHGTRAGRRRVGRGHRLEELAHDAEAVLALEQAGAGVEDLGAVVARAVAQDAEQPRLADPRRALEGEHAALARREPRQGGGDRRQLVVALQQAGRSDGDRGGRGRQQPLVQRDELGPGHRAELLAQQHPQLVVGADRLGDVPALDQHADQRRPGRLAEGRGGDRRAGGALGRRQRVPATAQSRGGDELERLDAQLVQVVAGTGQPGRVEVGQQPGLGEPGGFERWVGIAVRTSRGDELAHGLDVDPDRLGEDEPQRLAALEHGGLDGAAQPREHRRERRVARRRALVRPQRLDQLVTANGPPAVQHEVGERQPPLATAQLRLPALAGELDAELAAEVDLPATH